MSTPDPRERRRAAFALVRRKRTRQQAGLSPEARVECAEELRALWRPSACDADGSFMLAGRRHSGKVRPTDEPMELWREIRARLRGAA